MARNRYFEDEIIVERFNGSVLKRLFRYCKPYRKTLTKLIITMIIMSFLVLLPPLFNRLLVDYVFTEKGAAGIPYTTLAIIVMTAWLLVLASDVVWTLIRSRMMNKVGYRIVHDLRRDTFANLQQLGFDYFDSRPAGKILVRLTSYVDEIANIFSSAVVGLIVDGTKLLVVIILLFVLDWRLAVVIAAAVLPMGIILFLLHRRMRKLYRVHRNKHSNRTAYLAENISGTPVIKAFNRTKLNCEIQDDLTGQVTKSWRNVIKFNELFFPSIDFFFQVGTFAVYATVLFISQSASFGTITLGTLTSFVMYLGFFAGPLNNIALIIQQMSVASSNLERIFDTMDTPSSVTDCPDAYELPQIEGNVRFHDVSFAYEKGRNILEHFNLEVTAGKCVALVGPTGAGKTTVVNLISRFYNVTENHISIDGHDISRVKLHSLRAQVGVMMQDTFIFSGTVIDNIRYGNLDASDEECIEAAKAVFADAFIDRLPNGYYTKINEQGSDLSSGERQLLSFARVILSDPKILILDEATSSIDTETEEKIQAALNVILQGRTSFIIAHRLSTIKRADCILYIADKGIQEAGTHAQLMAQKGLYYQLATGTHG